VFRLSFRFSLGLALLVVNIGVAAVLATFAYRAAHDAIVDQAQRSVALVAESRERELTEMLERRQQRLEGFLTSLVSLCGERNGRMVSLEDQCLRTAVRGLHNSERATVTEVRSHERLLSRAGRTTDIRPPYPGQLARIEAVAGKGRLAMRAVHGDLAIDVQFSMDEVNAVFSDRAGLEAHGEAFLTDAAGYRLTDSPSTIPTAFPVSMSNIGGCVNGLTQTGLAIDYRGVNVISGVRPVKSIGGGCIVADVIYDEAVLPLQALGSVLVYVSGLLGLLGGAVSMFLSGIVTRPIKRLAVAARSLADGDLEAPVPVGGPSEVRQLGLTLSRMAASIRELVRSERQARFHAEAASRTKDDFLATLSHELRTPLNAVLGWASILTHTNYDKTRLSNGLKVIERNARLQSQMIEELLDVSRIAAGRVKLSLSNVLVTTAIDAALESARPGADAKGIELTRHLDRQATTVKADPRRLQQIIWNLLSNAVRFTPGGGRIEVIARRVQETVEIIVRDTGCGIGPEFLPLVFERFRQADSSTTRAHGGLGLGLAIVRDLVELHGGTVEAASEGENLGTTITVRLPAAARADQSDTSPIDVARGSRLVGAQVLVVDDDPDARDVLRTILEDAGARVTTSGSASETRAILSDAHPDLLIADIGMPGEDGYSLIRSIRGLPTSRSQVPAIALTAHNRPEDIAHALASGFQMHLAKPVDSARLVASIADLFSVAH
jgi:signal transduction histidine kinase